MTDAATASIVLLAIPLNDPRSAGDDPEKRVWGVWTAGDGIVARDLVRKDAEALVRASGPIAAESESHVSA